MGQKRHTAKAAGVGHDTNTGPAASCTRNRAHLPCPAGSMCEAGGEGGGVVGGGRAARAHTRTRTCTAYLHGVVGGKRVEHKPKALRLLPVEVAPVVQIKQRIKSGTRPHHAACNRLKNTRSCHHCTHSTRAVCVGEVAPRAAGHKLVGRGLWLILPRTQQGSQRSQGSAAARASMVRTPCRRARGSACPR